MANLTNADILYPKGKVKPEYFPGSTTVAADITAWLTDAYANAIVAALTTQAARDVAARAYAYYRAFETILLDMSADPSSVEMPDQGSKSWLLSQIEKFEAIRDENKAVWEDIITPPAEAVAEFQEFPPTMAMTTSVRYRGGGAG